MPPAPPRAIIDASSAILLFKAELIDACCAMLRLLMTRAVFDEVAVPDRPGAERLSRLVGRPAGIGLLDHPDGAPAEPAATDLNRLHRGERDTLHHYLNGAARFVIIDDGKGVNACRRQDIPHINALLCPRLLFFGGRLSATQAQASFSRIVDLGRYSPNVVAWAARCDRANLDFFFRSGR